MIINYSKKFINEGKDLYKVLLDLISRIHEQHRDVLIKRYESRIGEIVNGEVYQIWRNEILLTDDEGNDMSLPKSEQIPKDFFKKGESVRAVIKEVNIKNNI